MDSHRDSSMFYTSLYSESPSVWSTTSRHASRLFAKSANDSFFKTPNTKLFQTSSVKSNVSTSFLSVGENDDDDDNEKDNQMDQQPCASVYHQFFKSLTDIEAPSELLFEYEQLAIDHLKVTGEMINTRVQLVNERYNLFRLLSLLKLERNSWRLLRALATDRIERIGREEEIMDIFEVLSDKKLVEKLYDRNPEIREMQTAVDWLELNEFEDQEMERNKESVEFYSEGPHAWENTLHELKKARRDKKEDPTMCPNMDPDGPVRTKKPIHHLDKEDDDRLFRHIFRLLRSGQLTEGKIIAERQGHHWLSMALEGWLLHHNPNYEEFTNESMELQPILGNATRDLWKLVCWKSGDKMLHSERVLFACLSGNLQTVLTSPFCQRWEDGLWAHLRCSIDCQIEAELRETAISNPERMSRSIVDLPDEYWQNLKDMKEIFSSLEATSLGVSSLIEEKCHHGVQKYLLINDLNALVDHMYHWCGILNEVYKKKVEHSSKLHSGMTKDEFVMQDTESKIIAPQLFRFFAHLVLALKALFDYNQRQEICNAILESYISFLITNKQNQMVTRYCAFLPKSAQTEMMSKLMKEIEDPANRKMILIDAKAAQLDINEITANLVQTLRKQMPEREVVAELVPRTTEEDKKKIDALDWLLMYEVGYITCQYGQALHEANALMRFFLLSGKIEAALETFKKLPIDIIEKACREPNAVSPDQNQDIREYLCHKTFLDAHEAFIDWQQGYYNSRPKEPVALPTDRQVRFAEKMAHEQLKKEYEKDMVQWRNWISHRGCSVADKIENVFLFPGGWMVEMESEPEELMIIDDDRQHQLQQLRVKYIPQLTSMVQLVLTATRQYQRCLQIADLIADEEFGLFKLFNKEELKQVLAQFRTAAIEQLDHSSDPLGYGQS